MSVDHKTNTRNDDVSEKQNVVVKCGEWPTKKLKKTKEFWSRVNLFIVLWRFLSNPLRLWPSAIARGVLLPHKFSLSRRNNNHMLKSRWRSEKKNVSYVLFCHGLCVESLTKGWFYCVFFSSLHRLSWSWSEFGSWHLPLLGHINIFS